ncbi:P-loop containing nucleoside triphosphate hydrolase protein [Pavlovales sp. CCMP2436]|nr:P-loop containing nucleoside triphosphate hydrolase protein [Pavlovales sp. CCMP2436]
MQWAAACSRHGLRTALTCGRALSEHPPFQQFIKSKQALSHNSARAQGLARRALSSIYSAPPPPFGSWVTYAEEHVLRGADVRARPRLGVGNLDPPGSHGGYWQSLNDGVAGRASRGMHASAQPAGSAQPADGLAAEDERPALSKFVRDFDLRPRDIVRQLDKFVIGQRVLSVAVCDHFNHARRCAHDREAAEAERSKPNVLVVGPTGSGKTFLVRTLARLLNCPFIKADATKFSATGFVGRDVEELVRDLVDAAGVGSW